MNYDEPKIVVPRFCEEKGFYTTTKRSKMMGKIRAKNTKPELLLRRALWSKNIRYRINNKHLPGKPDITIKKYALAIFVDGAFWHGYDWETKRKTIKTNRRFWIPKIKRNMQRDKEINSALESMGFTVFRFWDHEVKQDVDTCVNDILIFISTGQIH